MTYNHMDRSSDRSAAIDEEGPATVCLFSVPVFACVACVPALTFVGAVLAPQPAYLVSICEAPLLKAADAPEAAASPTASDGATGTTHVRASASVGGQAQLVARYGLCLLDASTGAFTLAEFPDDHVRSRLRTLLARMPATELVVARRSLSDVTERILRFDAANAVRNDVPIKEFWNAPATANQLQHGGYFADKGVDVEVKDMPATVAAAIGRAKVAGSDVDAHGMLPSSMAMTALGGCLAYLRRCVIDRVMVSMKVFKEYVPPKLSVSDVVDATQPAAGAGAGAGAGAAAEDDDPSTSTLVLDGSTIINLELLANSVDGSRNGALVGVLEQCLSAHGKRMFNKWLCAPLRRIPDIVARQDAVAALMGATTCMDEARKTLRWMPDLERLLARCGAVRCCAVLWEPCVLYRVVAVPSDVARFSFMCVCMCGAFPFPAFTLLG